MKSSALLASILILSASSILPNFALAEDSVQQITEEQLHKQFFEGCLAASKNKYELYNNCIGKMSKVCLDNPDAFIELRSEFNTGVLFECSEIESKYWDKIFENDSSELIAKLKKYSADKRTIAALRTDLANMQERFGKECGYVTTQYGYRDGDLVQRGGIANEFICVTEIAAENAITVYLWNQKSQKSY